MTERRKGMIGESLWNLVEHLVRFFLTLFYRLLHRELTEEAFNNFIQFVKFGLIGVTNTLVSYLIYVASLFVFDLIGWQAKWDYVAANVIAFLLSVIWSWFWNSRLVFTAQEGERRCWWKTLLRTYVAYAFTGLFLANVLSFLWIELVHAPKVLAPILNLIINVPLNFFLNKLWAYRSKT